MLETIAVETAHRGALFSVERLRVRDAAGLEHEREVVRHPGAVAVVALLAAPPRLVLIRNERVAVGRRLWEVPAGKLEPGEAPRAAAARELIEETGYRAGRLEALGTFYTSPGFADELMHVFLAEDLGAAAQRLEPGESIEVFELALERVEAMIADGTVQDGKTIAALSLWERRVRGRPGRDGGPDERGRPGGPR